MHALQAVREQIRKLAVGGAPGKGDTQVYQVSDSEDEDLDDRHDNSGWVWEGGGVSGGGPPPPPHPADQHRLACVQGCGCTAPASFLNNKMGRKECRLCLLTAGQRPTRSRRK